MTYEVIFVVAVDGVHVHEVLAAGAGAWCALVGVVRAAEVVAQLVGDQVDIGKVTVAGNVQPIEGAAAETPGDVTHGVDETDTVKAYRC